MQHLDDVGLMTLDKCLRNFVGRIENRFHDSHLNHSLRRVTLVAALPR
jgi:hypothetical protein